MELDKIVVLCLAALIFGGASYLVWKNRQEEKNSPADPRPPAEENNAPIEKNSKKKKKISPNAPV